MEFAALASLPQEDLDVIRRKGCVVIKNVVDDAEAASWRADLSDYVKTNPVAGKFATHVCPEERALIGHPQVFRRKTSSSSSSSACPRCYDCAD